MINRLSNTTFILQYCFETAVNYDIHFGLSVIGGICLQSYDLVHIRLASLVGRVLSLLHILYCQAKAKRSIIFEFVVYSPKFELV